MNNDTITSQVTGCAKLYGVRYITQTKNTKNNIHFFYSHTGATDSESVCRWTVKPKQK